MSLKVITAQYRTPERLPADLTALRDALEKALKRIAQLENEVAHLRGEVPPETVPEDE